MGISDQHIKIAKSVLAMLSWKRLFKVGIISLICIVLVLAWLARGVIFNSKPHANFSRVPILAIPTQVKQEIDVAVRRDEHILAIQIVTINFQKNIRSETYASIDNSTLQEMYNRFVNNKIIETPLFDDNKINNTRIIRLINGEFVCLPYKDSMAYKYAPDAENIISYVCAIGIPPAYGEFTGILTIYLNNKPDKDLTDKLFLLSRAISTEIYDSNKPVDESKRQH